MYLAIAAESSTARILPALIATAPGRASPEERPVHTTPCVMTVSAVFPPQATRQTSIPTAATVRVMASLLISAAWRRGESCRWRRWDRRRRCRDGGRRSWRRGCRAAPRAVAARAERQRRDRACGARRPPTWRDRTLRGTRFRGWRECARAGV